MLIRVDFAFKGNQDKCTKFADAKMSQIFLGPGQPDLNFFFAFLCFCLVLGTLYSRILFRIRQLKNVELVQ